MGGSSSSHTKQPRVCFVSCLIRDENDELEQEEEEARRALIPVTLHSGRSTPALASARETPTSREKDVFSSADNSRQPSKTFTPREVQTSMFAVVTDTPLSPDKADKDATSLGKFPRQKEERCITPERVRPEAQPREMIRQSTPTRNAPTNGSDLAARPEVGDLVSLSSCAQLPEYLGKDAIVTATSEAHCTVAVLDESHCFCLGESWPNFKDVFIKSKDWRLGSRVMISGFTSLKAKQLNGLSGTIISHPRSGHPTFISKPTSPDKARLTFCIRLDEPSSSPANQCVLVEPQFLKTRQKSVDDVVEELTTIANDIPTA